MQLHHGAGKPLALKHKEYLLSHLATRPQCFVRVARSAKMEATRLPGADLCVKLTYVLC